MVPRRRRVFHRGFHVLEDFSVQNEICDTTTYQSRVNVVAWGKRISKVVERSLDDSFRVDAGEGRGWAELYLVVPGSREGD